MAKKTTPPKPYKSNTIAEISLKYKKSDIETFKVENSRQLHGVLLKMFDSDTIDYREEFIALFINRAMKLIGFIKLSSGGMAKCVVDPKMLFATALNCGAYSIVLSHNHPSGNLKPSEEDKIITKDIKDGCKVLDMLLLDHIIVSSEGYYSFADDGFITHY